MCLKIDWLDLRTYFSSDVLQIQLRLTWFPCHQALPSYHDIHHIQDVDNDDCLSKGVCCNVCCLRNKMPVFMFLYSWPIKITAMWHRSWESIQARILSATKWYAVIFIRVSSHRNQGFIHFMNWFCYGIKMERHEVTTFWHILLTILYHNYSLFSELQFDQESEGHMFVSPKTVICNQVNS